MQRYCSGIYHKDASKGWCLCSLLIINCLHMGFWGSMDHTRKELSLALSFSFCVIAGSTYQFLAHL